MQPTLGSQRKPLLENREEWRTPKIDVGPPAYVHSCGSPEADLSLLRLPESKTNATSTMPIRVQTRLGEPSKPWLRAATRTARQTPATSTDNGGSLRDAALNPRIRNKMPSEDLPGSKFLEIGTKNESIKEKQATTRSAILFHVHAIDRQDGSGFVRRDVNFTGFPCLSEGLRPALFFPSCNEVLSAV